jgi:hypothetical protein
MWSSDIVKYNSTQKGDPTLGDEMNFFEENET